MGYLKRENLTQYRWEEIIKLVWKSLKLENNNKDKINKTKSGVLEKVKNIDKNYPDWSGKQRKNRLHKKQEGWNCDRITDIKKLIMEYFEQIFVNNSNLGDMNKFLERQY